MKIDTHIGVLAFPFGTHAAPLLALVKRLATSSPPGVRFSFFNSAASNRGLFPGHGSDQPDGIRVFEVWDGISKDSSSTNVSHFEAIKLFLDASPGNFEQAMEAAEREAGGVKISCLITDAFLWFACDMAHNRGIPWVPFWTAASCSLTAHFHTDAIRDAVKSLPEIEQEDKELSFIPGLSRVRFSDLPPEIFEEKNPSPLANLINKMVPKLPQSTAIVLNSFEEIDPVITTDLKAKFRHFLNVGPSIVASPPPTNPNPVGEEGSKDPCLAFLETQSKPKSVVYVSFGTVISPPENELRALAGALESSKLPFLWSLNERAHGSLPDGFLQRTGGLGKVVTWAPQLKVLGNEKVGVFVTHCGWNSILESICSGVPMICRPFFGDQRVNARMVEDVWGIGLRVGGGVFTEEGTVEALGAVVSGEKGEAMRANVEALKGKARGAVKAKGSSSGNFEKLLDIVGAKASN